MKAITAVTSLATAVVVWRLLPGALLLPSPAQLRQANEALSAEVVRRIGRRGNVGTDARWPRGSGGGAHP